jgi:TPP-dependent indolepyruvate ferredoxin oxidoreductase alpha subunit
MDTLVYAPSASLDDKYLVEGNQVFITGVQALVRLPLLRREVDAKNGLNTAGFISGYRGSPLGTYDKQLWHERKRLADHHIIFQPGVNEELAATAVWGSTRRCSERRGTAAFSPLRATTMPVSLRRCRTRATSPSWMRKFRS